MTRSRTAAGPNAAPRPSNPVLRYVLIGDGRSPHLAKWARALSPKVELWVASSTGVSSALDDCVPARRRLELQTQPDAAGGNIGLLRQLPALARWLKTVDADWINPHYLTSHGTLALAAIKGWSLSGRLLASAWGSDVLVTPEQHLAYRWALKRVLAAADLATSDSQHMAQAMQRHGSREVMVFPFGLDALPAMAATKQPWLVYANRGLEPIYRPQDVLAWFQGLVTRQPEARLVVANDGSLRRELEAWVQAQGLADRVRFVGRLDAGAQAEWYGQAQWYVSLPRSDSVAVSVIEAMAHGALPVLSDLPANRELVRHGQNGLILPEPLQPPDGSGLDAMQALLAHARKVARLNRDWVVSHGLFEPAIGRLLARLREIDPGQGARHIVSGRGGR